MEELTDKLIAAFHDFSHFIASDGLPAIRMGSGEELAEIVARVVAEHYDKVESERADLLRAIDILTELSDPDEWNADDAINQVRAFLDSYRTLLEQTSG